MIQNWINFIFLHAVVLDMFQYCGYANYPLQLTDICNKKIRQIVAFLSSWLFNVLIFIKLFLFLKIFQLTLIFQWQLSQLSSFSDNSEHPHFLTSYIFLCIIIPSNTQHISTSAYSIIGTYNFHPQKCSNHAIH